MEPILQFDSVTKTYANGTTALEGFQLDLPEGEFVSLLGASGCGKSTVLRLAAGLAEPSGGTVRLGPACRQRGSVGLVFQQPTLMPWRDVGGNVRVPLELMDVGGQEAEARVTECLNDVGLAREADLYPGQLSGGMQMRVSVARAMATRPALLLMDEPFAALDEMTRFALNDVLLRMQEGSRLTTLFVTHSIYESVFLSDHIAIMTPGPGRVMEIVDIPEPRPRVRSFRTSPEFFAYCAKVSSLLEAALSEDNNAPVPAD